MAVSAVDDDSDQAVPHPPVVMDNESDDPTLYKYRDFANVPEDHDRNKGDDAGNKSNNDADNGNNGNKDDVATADNTPSLPPPDPSDTTTNAARSLETSIRVQKFPVKLYAILAQKEFADIVSWMPHGRSWKVLKPNLFESLVMPLFFEYSNYHSFNRLVNAWSFRRISSGPDRGSYYHEVSLRQLDGQQVDRSVTSGVEIWCDEKRSIASEGAGTATAHGGDDKQDAT